MGNSYLNAKLLRKKDFFLTVNQFEKENKELTFLLILQLYKIQTFL